MKLLYLLCIAACCVTSCGLFAPLEPEPPVGSAPKDPFQFEDILRNTGETFAVSGYDDLFITRGDVYLAQGRRFSKDALIDHLQSIASAPAFADLTVQWTPDSVRALLKNDTVEIHPSYKIWVDGNTGRPADFEAPCTFLLIYQSNRWLIFQWRDGYSGKSLFNPEFN